MNAVVYDRHGDPTRVLRTTRDQTQAPGAGHVVVALEAAAVHPADLLTIHGQYAARPRFPQAVPGLEGVGRVVARGPDVELAEGARVILPLGSGTWRDRLVVRADQLAEAPMDGDPLQLAMAVVNPATAWLLLEHVVRPRTGEWIVQSAANGAVGQLVAAFARERGVHTVNVVRREAAGSLVRNAGGDVVVVDDEDLAVEVRRYTDGAQIRLALDAVGGATTQRLAESLAWGGTVLAYGAMSGEPAQLGADQTLFRDIRLRGFWLSAWFQQASQDDRSALVQRMVDRVAAGDVRVPIAATYPLADARDAMKHAARAGRDGKVVLLGEAYEG